MTTPTPDLPKAEHVNTDRCGFDRNGSHSAGHYVCTCGWDDSLPVEHMDIPAMLRSSAPAAPEGEPVEPLCPCSFLHQPHDGCNGQPYDNRARAYIDHLRAALAEARKERDAVQARLDWAANELLACDYGDNPERKGIGYIVYGWRDLAGIHNRRIYGPTINEAIDAALSRSGRDEG